MLKLITYGRTAPVDQQVKKSHLAICHIYQNIIEYDIKMIVLTELPVGGHLSKVYWNSHQLIPCGENP